MKYQPKITFMGAGSSIFAKNILGDCMLTPSLQNSHIALYDIDRKRLKESALMLQSLNKNINKSRAKITPHLGISNRRTALKDADYVINAIQIGGYKPSTVIDFEIPKKYGLKQTIGDTLGIGGIFRALRTIPVMLDFARDIEDFCPDALLINYTNPLATLTAFMLRATNVRTVGLCHSVQDCVPSLLKMLKMGNSVKKVQWKIAGINHMSWLLEITDDGKDLYPEIKRRATKLNRESRKKDAKKHIDMVRLEMMRHFGYYITESSEHTAEYSPYWIKSQYPELIDEFNIPLDEYPRRCVQQIKDWEQQREQLVPALAVVEIPCLVDRNGVQGCFVGELPTQCAALNLTNINVQFMIIEAALSGRKEAIYQAAMLDPHTGSELVLDDIKRLCDDLIKAHGDILPKYK